MGLRPLGLAALLCLSPLALANPEFHIEATVSNSGWVAGTISSNDPKVRFINPLLSLPIPNSDRVARRTFPGIVDTGEHQFGPTGDGRWWFVTRLPERYGALGHTKYGTFANGSWYPQPMLDNKPARGSWTVTLKSPSQTTAILGNTIGEKTLQWSGEGQLVSLALVPKAQTLVLSENDQTLILISRSAHKPVQQFLQNEWPTLSAIVQQKEGVAVIAPMRRRLARAGEGLTFISDRAFRLTPGFRTVHREAVIRGLIQGHLTLDSQQLEETTAAILSSAHEREQRRSVAEGLLQYGSWNPVIYAILHSGTMPFYSETLGKTHASDPLRDALLERLAPHTPGTVVAAQLEAQFGAEAATEFGANLAEGLSLDEALEQSPITKSDLSQWEVPYPEQDYLIQPASDTNPLQIIRNAPPTAPAETIHIQVGEEPRVWQTSEGSDSLVIEGKPRRLVVDTTQITKQVDYKNDRWPQPWSLTTAASITTINLSRGYLEGYASGWFRKSNNSKNIPSLSLSTSRENWLTARVGFLHQFGRDITGTLQQQRLSFSLYSSLLNPNYAKTDESKITTEGSITWRWDTRNDDVFPRQGQGLHASSGAGFIPNTTHRWWYVSSGGTKLFSPHPHHVLATRASLAYANSSLEHRLLDMGGPSALRSLPPSEALVEARGIAIMEYRVSILRDLSLPLFLIWGSNVQLSAGLECGAGTRQTQTIGACGATAGITGTGDALGGIPQMMGLTAAWPLWAQGLDYTANLAPELYLRWWQEF